jgi:serine phosphatase RsbU (regulator of sigma subunit)
MDKELAAQEISRQKEELTIKNKNITDSINYAKKIQVAMMPSEKTFKRILPNSFVLHKPRDIVSGDFYWIYERNEKVFIAAVDCTGHGVPGAFMSILGVELFRKITQGNIENPGHILSRLNEDFSKIFNDVEDISLKDGMDISFCVIDKINNKLEFAGAFNPLYLIRENKIIETKGNRFSVSMEKKQEELIFQTHNMNLQKGDMIYIFSDGFADQFGGYEVKKFKYRRFRHLLLNIHNLPLEKQKSYLEESMEAWKGNQEQVDDILVIGIKADF